MTVIEYRKLGDVCEVSRGTNITRKSAVVGDVPVVAGGIKPTYFHNSPNRPANIVTISGSGANAGYVNFYDIPIYASDCTTVLPKHPEYLSTRYVYLYLRSTQKFIFDHLRQGSAQPHVYPRDISKLEIPVPPLPEQQRIVAILDEAFASIASAVEATEKNLANAEELFQSQLNLYFNNSGDAVNDRASIFPISEVCYVINGATPKTKVPSYWDGPHAWITPAEMGNLTTPYIAETRRTITDAGLSNCSASLLPAKSVILSSRAPIGHLVINQVPMATNQGCKGLIPHEGLESKYLYYFLLASVDLLNDLGSGTTFKELSATKLKSVHIPVPPLPEQRRIVATLDDLRKQSHNLEYLYGEKLDALAELKQSILQKAFSGELTTDPDKSLAEAGL